MATHVAAREAVFALRREIARIEGVLPERLAAPLDPACVSGQGRPATPAVIRRADAPLSTGVERLDFVLGGGVPRAALTEIHGAQTRDAGAVAGFVLALASLLAKPLAAQDRPPLLWIGTMDIIREAGQTYARGLETAFGIEPDGIFFARAPKLTDALWIAEEAARVKALSAVVLELRGNPAGLDLTATRRLHARAQAAGRPLFLLRHAGCPEPTAAPVRLVVAPAKAAPRATLAGPLAGSIGRPAFTVSVGKSRTALPGQFILEWNGDEHAFAERPHADRPGRPQGVQPREDRPPERRPAHSFAVVPLPAGGAHPPPTAGAVVAFRQDGARATGSAAAGGQPSPQQRPAPRRA